MLELSWRIADTPHVVSHSMRIFWALNALMSIAAT